MAKQQVAYLIADIESVKPDTLKFLNRILSNLENQAYYSSFKNPPAPFSTDDCGVFPPELEWYLERAVNIPILSNEESQLQNQVKQLIEKYADDEENFWSAYEKQQQSVLDEILQG